MFFFFSGRYNIVVMNLFYNERKRTQVRLVKEAYVKFVLFCLLVLLREWLIPLDQMTGLRLLPTWTFCLLSMYVAELAIKSPRYSFFLYLTGLMILVNRLFFQEPLLSVEWMMKLISLLRSDFYHMYWQEWQEVRPSTVFFWTGIGLVLIVPLLRFLVVKKGWGIRFVLLTGAYLSILDSFQLYDAKTAMVRLLFTGFVMLAALELHRLQQASYWLDARKWARWKPVLVSLGMVGIMVGIAFFAPKYGPSWPDPVAYFTRKTSTEAAKVQPIVRTVSYTNNDERLGGPLIDDEELVFTAVTSDKFYWRGDTKDTYTGIGWTKREQKMQPVLTPYRYKWPSFFYDGAAVKEVQATLQFSDQYRYPQLFYPGQLKQLTHYIPQTMTVMYEPDGGYIQTRDGVYDVFHQDEVYKEPGSIYLKMSEYSLISDVPLLDEKKMLAVTNDYPDEIKQYYLQLPKNLPSRVKQLAKKITSQSPNEYAKVQAILQYLHDSGKYKYERMNVPPVEPGRDFVDQFLFEDMRGYCDHFSTSMVVMLRSIGIPARWAKGFAPGKQSGMDASGNYIMEIRNKDTHSWAEVYFPHYGWIPFEPTPTFTSPVQLKTAQSAVKHAVPVSSSPASADIPKQALKEKEAEPDTESAVPWGYLMAAILLGILGYALWSRRFRVRRWMLKNEVLLLQKQMPFREQYLALLGILGRDYSPRSAHETVREYIDRLELSYDEKDDIRQVTRLFEEMVYGRREAEEELRKNAIHIVTRLVKQLKGPTR